MRYDEMRQYQMYKIYIRGTRWFPVKHWKCMKVRGTMLFQPQKIDDALRLISTASFDVWPQNQWVQSNFPSFSLPRLQSHETSRLWKQGEGPQKRCRYFVRFPRKTPWASKIHGLAKSMYETPSPPFSKQAFEAKYRKCMRNIPHLFR